MIHTLKVDCTENIQVINVIWKLDALYSVFPVFPVFPRAAWDCHCYIQTLGVEDFSNS